MARKKLNLIGVDPGFFLLLSDPLLTFRRKSQGEGSLPKIALGMLACPFSGLKGTKIGAEGSVLENFGEFSKKMA